MKQYSLEKLDNIDIRIKEILNEKFIDITTSDINIDEKIKLLDDLLNKIHNTRKMINEIKISKDEQIRKYIRNTLPPEILNINILTYKALLMYFRDSFINKKIKLQFRKYEKENKISSEKLRKVFITEEIPLKVYLNNFPHLIGIKRDFLGNSNLTIEYILYEYKLIDDFVNDSTNTDIEKLETFSWIISTLYNPSWIIKKKGIIAENFEADLVFIKSIFYPKNYSKQKKYFYHIVGLDYIKEENFFIIKSQFPIKNKSILKKKFDLEDYEALLFKKY